MTKSLAALLFFLLCFKIAVSQQPVPSKDFPDSVVIKVHPSYNNVNGFHRWLFGENYRREWAAPVKLPLIRIQTVYGGLTPEEFGGGMETKSVRMKDKTGKEWVVRSVEKVPDKLLPENLRGTFALDWVDDEYSGQHPYSALIVPPLADAAKVPHANPVIGVLVADTALRTFSSQFAGRVVLLEEREPTGDSKNTLKMVADLNESNEYRFDKEEFLRARMLDLLVGDWDRHEDQWRWTVDKKDKDQIYTAVPRDRDQVLHLREGVLPSLAGLPWFDPVLGKFDGPIPDIKYAIFKTKFLQQYPDGQFSFEEWMKVVNDFVKAETDDVLKAGLDRLPKALAGAREDELLAKLKQRRDNIPAAMTEYYYFINKIVDIRLSNQDESVVIEDAPDGGMHIVVARRNKSGKAKEVLMDMVYKPAVTKEIRLYVAGGDDNVSINNAKSPIKLRIVGDAGTKTYEVKQAYKKIQLYGRTDSITFTGDTGRLKKHLSNDTSNTHILTTNRYNLWMPLATGSINLDDGFLLGLGFKYTGKDGFRKLPYSTVQEVMVTHSFETDAFRINYNGQWMQAIGKADITLNTVIDAPDNTTNFFGEGNNTVLDKTGDYHKYYRTRFDLYQFDPALRWHTGKRSTFSIGPSLEFYHFDANGNAGRSIYQPGLIKSYDSTSFNTNKAHAGLVASYISDTKNNNVLPSKGYYLDIKLQGIAGLNSNSKSFMQIKPEFTYFLKIDTAARLVLSDRIGGGVSIGNPAFYQYFLLGGQGNLLGYLQNRFAGQQMAYDNLQARFRIANVGGYILPGQLGITGFYDTGRVWIDGEHSNIWHNGAGGGIYFAPASLTVIQVIFGHSNEGWYPYIAFNFRI